MKEDRSKRRSEAKKSESSESDSNNILRLLPYLKPFLPRISLGLLCGILFGLSNGALVLTTRVLTGQVLDGKENITQSQAVQPASSGTVTNEAVTPTPVVHQKKEIATPAFVENIRLKLSGVKDRLMARINAMLASVIENKGESSGRSAAIAIMAAFLPAMFCLRGLFQFGSTYLIAWTANRMVNEMRDRLFAHLQSLSLDYFNRNSVGDVMSRVMNDTQIVQRLVSSVIGDAIQQPFTLLFVIGTMVVLVDTRLLLLSMITLPLCLIPIIFFGRKVRRAAKGMRLKSSQLTSVLHENITGVRVVKAYNMEQQEIDKFARNNRKFFNNTVSILRANQMLGPMIEVVGSLGVSLIFVYALTHNLAFADVASFVAGMLLLYPPIKKLASVHNSLIMVSTVSERLFSLLDKKPGVEEKPDAIVLKGAPKLIKFENVRFAYRDKEVFHGINLSVAQGEFLAIVGPTGAGKSTLINLLLRFYDPDQGRVTFDGIDLRDIKLSSLREMIGYVTQDPILFDDTIASNIAVGKPGATPKEIELAARLANAEEFILARETKYETVIGEKGCNFSGGQRQRLAIARAIMKNAPILVLDEATSSLDSESEKLVQDALTQLTKGKTVFAIAHRFSTIMNADRIIVIDKGVVAESGTHQELLAKNGVYRRLFDLQFNSE